MKKYNTPEMNVSMFENESVLTLSTADWENQYAAAGASYKTTWAELKEKGLNVTF